MKIPQSIRMRMKLDSRAGRHESLEERVSREDRGQMNLTGLFIGILVSGIVAMGIFIPIWNDMMASANLTGITDTVFGYVPLFVALMLLVGIAGPLMKTV